MSIEELKPCPFCGSEDVECNDIKCSCHNCDASILTGRTERNIEHWNRRASEEWISANYRKPESCGHNHYSTSVLGYCGHTKSQYTVVFDWEDHVFRHFHGGDKAYYISHWKPLESNPA